MRAADLYHSMAFDKAIDTPNGMGGTKRGWAEHFQSRANVRFLRGGEVIIGARLAGRQPVVVTIPSHQKARDITPEWRMRDARDGTIYNIRTVIPSDDRRWMEITAESGVPE